jgi:hypothetical protein
MEITSSEWEHLSYRLEHGDRPTGAFMVMGPSGAVAERIQALLESCAARGAQARYFLCSSQGLFRIPCYTPIVERPKAGDRPNAFHVLDEIGPEGYTVQQPVSELEQALEGHGGDEQLIVIECLTPPTSSERTFIQHMLMSPLKRRLPVLVFAHQHDHRSPAHEQLYAPSDAESLLVLYMCGGRLRDVDWCRIAGRRVDEVAHDSSVISLRRAESYRWLCYADRRTAEQAEVFYRGCHPAKRRELAKNLLQALPYATGYPFLAIAGATADVQTMRSSYSSHTIRLALAESNIVVRYFHQMRRLARTTGADSLTGIATLNCIAAMLRSYTAGALRIYKFVRKADLRGIDKRAIAQLWFELGQRLAKAKGAQQWEYAADCFRRSREYVNQAVEIDPDILRSLLAAIANGEALIAVREQQRNSARRLEESALVGLKEAGTSLDLIAQQVLLGTHLGDVHLRMFSDVDAAIEQYQAAHTLAISHDAIKARQYVAPKLADALIRARRYEEATLVLEGLLAQLHQPPGVHTLSNVTVELRALLTLAQAYLALERWRLATLCYWRLLRHPERLMPAVLRGIVSNIERCRPGIHPRLRSRMARLVRQQEESISGVVRVQKLLSTM